MQASQKNRRSKTRQKQQQQYDDNNNNMLMMTMKKKKKKNKQINESIVCAISSPSSHLSRISMNIHKFFRSFFSFKKKIHSQCVCVCALLCIYIYEIRDELCVCADDNHNKAIASLPGPFSPGLNYQSSMIFILCVRARCARCVFVVLQPIIHHMSNVVVVVVFFSSKKRLFFVCNECTHCTSASSFPFLLFGFSFL